MSPLEFVQRLAALVPRPRLHLTRFHGVLAPNAGLRAAIVPGPAQKPSVASRHGSVRCHFPCRSTPGSGLTPAPSKKPARGGLTWRAFYSVQFAATREADACEGETEVRLKRGVTLLHYRNRLTMLPCLRGGGARQVGAHPRQRFSIGGDVRESYTRDATIADRDGGQWRRRNGACG